MSIEVRVTKETIHIQCGDETLEFPLSRVYEGSVGRDEEAPTTPPNEPSPSTQPDRKETTEPGGDRDRPRHGAPKPPPGVMGIISAGTFDLGEIRWLPLKGYTPWKFGVDRYFSDLMERPTEPSISHVHTVTGREVLVIDICLPRGSWVSSAQLRELQVGLRKLERPAALRVFELE